MTNLNNRQQTEMFKAQAMQQAILSDTAAENATRQFNAASENQTNQFMANMKTQVSQFNASQKNSMAQFNAGQTNAARQFNAQQQNQRDQFNANNALVVAQANAQWRQNTATLNAAAQNEANMQKAREINGITTSALDNLWQRERDLMDYANSSAESSKDRALNLLLADKNVDLFKQKLAAEENQAASEFWVNLGYKAMGWD